MTADSINGAFEAVGALFALANLRRLHKDKKVQGVSLWAAGFFASWGLWNLYYYPSLGQWASLAGGAFLAGLNTWWVLLALYYKRKPSPDLRYYEKPRCNGRMSPALQILLDEAKFYVMSDIEKEAQRQGFARANVALDKDPKGRTVPCQQDPFCCKGYAGGCSCEPKVPMPGQELPPSCLEPRMCNNPACMVTGHCQEMMLGRMGL